MNPTTMEPADYWKLRAINADLERDQAMLMATQARLEGGRQRRQVLWAELAAKYSLEPDKGYTARDEDCSLTETT